MDTVVEVQARAESLAERALLRVEKLSAGYDESLILKGVSMAVPENKVVALLGRNGVGKTTLLNALLGLVPASGGEIHFGGTRIDKLSPDTRARLGIGYVPQG